MTSELVLLLVMSVAITTTSFNRIQDALQSAGPSLSARMEKHLMTGHIFCKKSQSIDDFDPKGCEWGK